MLSAPTSTAPAASIRSISVASRGAGARSRLIFEPARVEIPFTSNRFFTANGTPASGPGLLPAASSTSTCRALARARSAVTSVKQLRRPLCCAMRASAVSVASSADNLREATALAISAADSGVVMATSGAEDTGRLALVGQLKFVDEARHAQRNFQIRPYRRTPCVLDSQVQGLRDRGDVVIDAAGTHCSSQSPLLTMRLARA